MKIKYTIGSCCWEMSKLVSEVNEAIKNLPKNEEILDIKYSSWGHEDTEAADSWTRYSALILIGEKESKG